MVISMEQYVALRRDFLDIAKLHLSPADLIYLKSYYGPVINSVRDSDYIEDIEDLVKILEKRGLIRYDNIAPLKYIAQLYLKHVNIIDKLDHYNAWMKSNGYLYTPPTHLYQIRNVNYNPEPSAPSFQEAHTGHPATSSNSNTDYGSRMNQNENPGYNAPQLSTGPLQILSKREAHLQTKVFEMLSKKLEKYWIDMARVLDIRECDINNIDNRYPNYQDKAYAALKMFSEETDLNYWQKTLKKALVKARRSDLKDDVEELASRKF